MRKDRNNIINRMVEKNKIADKKMNKIRKNMNGSEDPDKKHYFLSIYELYAFRTIVCDLHLHGKCKDSDKCPFSHCLTWQRRNPNSHYYSPKLCPEICFVRSNEKMNLIRRCKKGKICTFAHSKEEQLYHPLMYKTKECSLYPNCNRYYCPFSHGKNEIRTPENIRDSIDEVTKNSSNGIFKNSHQLLSNMGGGTKLINGNNIDYFNNKNNNNLLNNYSISNNINNINDKNIKNSSFFNNNVYMGGNERTSKKMKDTSIQLNCPLVNQETEKNDYCISNLNSLWYTNNNWNFHPSFMDMISFTDNNTNINNSELNIRRNNELLTDNKFETEYDQIWKEISTEYNNKSHI
ncbi:hypothetical protein FG386_003112 [Cryptosporidium ryanae]|uniref:uncharacterized protein n=1 Tax=Cryptosporidium ryanae TaxID=515981 RepID=UPI00351AA362|nr:hypothetical protein FG386_003112 [Cryptosporidium ryanae]